MRALAAAIALALLGAGPAQAQPAEGFTVLRGSVAPGRAPGTTIVTTDGSDTRFYLGARYRHHSVARAAWREQPRAPFEVRFDFQLLTPGRWALEVGGLGLTVIMSRDRLGFFVDDAQMMGSMFADLPGIGGPGWREVRIRRTRRDVIVLVDGREVGRTAAPASAPSPVVLGVRGAPGHRSRVAIRGFVVAALATARAAGD